MLDRLQVVAPPEVALDLLPLEVVLFSELYVVFRRVVAVPLSAEWSAVGGAPAPVPPPGGETATVIVTIAGEEVVRKQVPIARLIAVSDALREVFADAAPTGNTAPPPMTGLDRLRMALNNSKNERAAAADEPKAVTVDRRLLPGSPLKSSDGEVYVEFKDAVRLMSEVTNEKGVAEFPPGFPLEGPPTVFYCSKFITRYGIAPLPRHGKWLSETRTDPKSHVARLHELINEAYEAMVCVDQLYTPRLLSAEILTRAMQEIEETAVKDEDLDSATTFYKGRAKLPGGACVSPALQEWGSKRLERKVNVLKFTQKANGLREAKKKAGKKNTERSLSFLPGSSRGASIVNVVTLLRV